MTGLSAEGKALDFRLEQSVTVRPRRAPEALSTGIRFVPGRGGIILPTDRNSRLIAEWRTGEVP